jgi:transcriptional regulator with XRE-family HTH domain
MFLNSLDAVVARLRRGKHVRKQFVESHINKTLAHQIRATRDRLGWSQERLAREVGMNQNAISRLESPDYGKPTITTLKRLAAALDVALVVRLVPFSELAYWVSGTSYLNKGLSTESLAVPDFAAEDSSGALGLLADEIALRPVAQEPDAWPLAPQRSSDAVRVPTFAEQNRTIHERRYRTRRTRSRRNKVTVIRKPPRRANVLTDDSQILNQGIALGAEFSRSTFSVGGESLPQALDGATGTFAHGRSTYAMGATGTTKPGQCSGFPLTVLKDVPSGGGELIDI